MPDPTSPHDRFFKDVMSRPEAARDFLQHHLPASVAALLDLASLRLVKDSFVDGDLREHFSDLIYEVGLSGGSAAFVYVLFEHKSSPEPLVAFHLLRYMVRAWERCLREREPLRPILPVVVYHGAAAWKVPTSFQDLFDLPEALAAYVPQYRYWLRDLSELSDQEVRGAVVLRVGLLALKSIFREDLRARLPVILGLLRELAGQQAGIEYIRTVLLYFSTAAERVGASDLREAAETAIPGLGGSLMPTIAQTWIEEGKQQGLQEGKQQGLQEGLRLGILQVIETRFGKVAPEIVASVAKVESASRLEDLHRAALLAASLAELRQFLERPSG